MVRNRLKWWLVGQGLWRSGVVTPAKSYLMNDIFIKFNRLLEICGLNVFFFFINRHIIIKICIALVFKKIQKIYIFNITKHKIQIQKNEKYIRVYGILN